MTDRHKHRPITFRPPEGDRARLLAYAERAGLPVRRVLALALAQFLDRESGVTTQPAETPQPARVEPPRKRQPRPAERTKGKRDGIPHRCPVKGWCETCGEMKGRRS